MVSGDEFESLRKELIGFCYRMLGSLPDAEDVAQDAYLRWEQAGRPQLDSPRRWYLRVCARRSWKIMPAKPSWTKRFRLR